ncbi:hypothetical protein [Clostridium sp.]|uniref:hypothetical protein n=1 Tax=Clostridium sp. TaxID=1506 RepID=UPI002FC5B5C1
MKLSTLFKSPIFYVLLIFSLTLAFLGLNNISKASEKKETLTNQQIEKVRTNLKIISSSPVMSSNPHDYIREHKKEYDEIIQMGEPVVDLFIDEFKKGKLKGLDTWITAWICNEILGEKNPIKIWAEDHENGWDSGEDWYEKYMKIKKIK